MSDVEKRFEFGKNWLDFVERSFSEERAAVAEQHLMSFVGLDDLKSFEFLDIGCGSGLHSLAAFRRGARTIRGFDYDENSVRATLGLRARVGNPETWSVGRGDILDDAFVESLGKWSFVYSWGVLHHTGAMWKAIENAQKTVADGGLFYIALYSADVQPDREYWLDVKRKYNAASPLKKRMMVWSYIWTHGMGRNPFRAPSVVYRVLNYRFNRGMNYFADIRDWLGGWPMEFAFDKDVVDFLEGRHGFKLLKIKAGEANTEFLFRKTSE